ncbi:hypothetical protein [Deminuibacter soli]|uniref:Uncharacterized protein n=1 Tax=Deminuibacter soli TaxID=2291815 RepID=A0A3E1NIK5_9BACT|nr:hypothetical protein [Deminuibacter soli]RFM27760.1 hypothetical protein DXN05_13750 [Deminuibacter soli]
MENIITTYNRIKTTQFREHSDLLKLRLTLLEVMSHFSKEYQKVSNPVMRHHIYVTFYRLESVYKKTVTTLWHTPLHFKKTKRDTLQHISNFLNKAEHLDTKMEYRMQPQSAATGMQVALA